MKLIAIEHRSIYDVDTHLHLKTKIKVLKGPTDVKNKLWAITVNILRSIICDKMLASS